MEKKKLDDITILRVIGILLVVLAHATHAYTSGWVYETHVKSSFFRRLTLYVYSFHMPLFLFISGAVYYFCRKELEKYNDFKAFAWNKIKRLIVPYIFVGSVYLVPIRLKLGINLYPGITYGGAIFNQILRVQIPGGLWYVVMLFNIFIVFRLFEKLIDANPIITNLIIFSFLYYWSPKITNQYQISRTCFHIIYFYLGYLFQQYKNQIIEKLKMLKYPFWILFITHFCLFTFMRKCLRVPYPYFLWRMLNLSVRIIVPVLGIGYCYFAVLWILNKIPKITENKIIKVLDKNNFIIYLFHEPIIYCILYKLYDSSMKPIILVNICFWVSLLGSLILAFIINKSIILRFLTGNKFKKNILNKRFINT